MYVCEYVCEYVWVTVCVCMWVGGCVGVCGCGCVGVGVVPTSGFNNTVSAERCSIIISI